MLILNPSVSLRSALAVVIISAMLAIASGCGKKVTRVDSNEVTDLSGKWNDTDSRLVSGEMIDDVLSRPWISNFNREKGKVPVIIVGAVRNLSHEHINTRTFISDLERELINSGEVQFVASAGERTEIREERRDQDLNASEATRKSMGQESGADFMLKGTVNTIVDTARGDQARFYQVDLMLIDLESNRKVWIGQKKIKKTVEKNSWRL